MAIQKEKSEKNVVDITIIEPTQLKEVQGLKAKQMAIVKKNPFVEITDNASFTKAKAHRTALQKASIEVENQDTAIGKFLKDFRSKIGELLESCSKITRDAYDKQQLEVKRYEGILKEEKERKDKIEQERKDTIKKSIDDAEQSFIEKINSMTYETMDRLEAEIKADIEQKNETFEEFDAFFDKVVETIGEKILVKKEALKYSFNQKELARKSGIESKIKSLVFDAKEILFKMTVESAGADGKKIKEITETDFDFMEYTTEFKREKDIIMADLTDAIERLKKAEAARIEKEEQDKELAEFRAEKLLKKRQDILFNANMREDKNGDFELLEADGNVAVVYSKESVKTDSDETFEGNLVNIENRRKSIEAAKEAQPEPVVEPAAENQPVSKFEAAVNAAAETTPEAPTTLEAAQNALKGSNHQPGSSRFNEMKSAPETKELSPGLGNPKTLGEFRDMTKHLPDSLALMSLNGNMVNEIELSHNNDFNELWINING